MLIKIHGGDYVINLGMVVSAEYFEDHDYWRVKMINGEEYDLEGEDKDKFEKAIAA